MTPMEAMTLALIDAQDARVRAMQEVQRLQEKVEEMEAAKKPPPERKRGK